MKQFLQHKIHEGGENPGQRKEKFMSHSISAKVWIISMAK